MLFGNPVRYPIVTRLTAGRFYRSQPFGCTGSGWEPQLGSCLHFHRGVDISHGDGACGRVVIAAAAGTVFWAGALNDGANAVSIRHVGGWATGYGHCHPMVRQGQKVTKGQQIGTMDQSGPATGCHVHFTVKSDFPSAGDVNAFWLDDPKYGASGMSPRGKGTWIDPWPRLEQNVTVHPNVAPAGINIRTVPQLNDTTIFATTGADGHIHRRGDNADLGLTITPRPWYGVVAGATYSVGGTSSNLWERMYLSGAYRFVASLLADRSAS